MTIDRLPAETLINLNKLDRRWESIRTGKFNNPEIVYTSEDRLNSIDFDVAIAGGTLGIILGTALQLQGLAVAVIEAGKLQGRAQEWNISRGELAILVELELLTDAELEIAIATEYNPARIALPNMPDIWVKDVLNIGIDPIYLLATLKSKFIAAGGKLLEFTTCDRVTIHPDGINIQAGGDQLNSRLLIDMMGHGSPIASQARGQVKPEGICLVVGSWAHGFDRNDTGDIFAAFTPLQHQCQYFWEAFPAKDGRTTYLFSYLDAAPERFSLEFLMSEYFRLLPEYQQVELDAITFDRYLFGCFPAYRQSPLRTGWNRILLVGDSSGSQSPVSFGGFGAMLRHLGRLTAGISDAIAADSLTSRDLTLLQPYQPNIAVTWMFQRAMGAQIDRQLNPAQINNLLSSVFRSMNDLGDDVLRPFLQDVVQFRALSRTLFRTAISSPLDVIPVIPQVGIPTLLAWSIDYLNLGLYTGLYPIGRLLQPLIDRLPRSQQYYYRQLIQSWKYGAGKDYHLLMPRE
jgi:lycopene cyclase CruP